MFSVSVGVCPAIYWLGRYRGGKFDLVNAEGPYALDLGDVVYAPNLMVDKQVGGAGRGGGGGGGVRHGSGAVRGGMCAAGWAKGNLREYLVPRPRVVWELVAG
jgi:hypothetical protein